MLVTLFGRVWGYAIGITILVLFCAILFNVLLFPVELLRTTIPGTVMIVIAITMPICVWAGYRVRENAILRHKLQALVDRDRLTDVATRDFFFARLLDLPDAYGVSLMIDIDHFKQVNDAHGHLVGDDVIHAVAQIMRAQIREEDIVCRFGGEEFVVFLRKASAQEGWVIAERIRETVQTARTPTAVGELSVTVSVGGSIKDKIEHVDAAIKRADDCLYRAKRLGRNRTVVDWAMPQNALSA